MNEQLWSDNKMWMALVGKLKSDNTVDVFDASNIMRQMRDEYEAALANANAWRTIEDDEVWLRLPDEAGGIL